MEIEKEMIEFIKENNLTPFNIYKTPIKNEGESLFKTRDAKSVNNRVIAKISSFFSFSDSSNLLNYFYFTNDPLEISKRQEYFKTISTKKENNFLRKIKKPRATWGPKYGIVAVTDNEDSFKELKNLDIPVKFILNEDDVRDLENYDVVQVVDVDTFSGVIEQLPQSVFLDSIDEVYLERYLEILSGWDENLKIISEINDENIKEIVSELRPILSLIDKEKKEKIIRKDVEDELEVINEEVSNSFKNLNISGEILFNMLSDKKLPQELDKMISVALKKSKIPEHLYDVGIPVKINEQELEEYLKIQDANENTDFAGKIKKNSHLLKKIPEKLDRLSALLLLYDFKAGISKFNNDNNNYPESSTDLKISNSKNIFLDNPQDISFYLNENERCSILTGANSGGKTTLLEHIIQLIVLTNIGLPVSGNVRLPIFSEIYYFAKNKGSASKGAFETLLTQMSKIKPGKQTLILADEIEAVTEPGVAGKIIAATSEYFIIKNCFLVIATHLGYEIEKVLPKNARIDGISAKGLDNNNELIVDHNPIIGKLANSTPELIVEKMANSNLHEYFNYINDYLKRE